MPTWAWLAVGLAPGVLCVALTIPLLRFLQSRHLSALARDLPDPPRWPRVSVLVAARDEAQKIEAAVGSLAALDYPDLEVIAVDDRSTDGSREILDRIGRAHPHVRVLHIEELPEGWLGKPHALARASEQATGEFLVFTDADVVFAPSLLRLVMRYVERHGLDHLSVFPKSYGRGWWERVVIAFFAFCGLASMRIWQITDPRSSSHAGVGAFNMVRASTYRAFGGHGLLRREVVDDVLLGRAAKAWSGRSDVAIGLDLLGVHWQVGARGVVRGLEKNGFAALRYSVAAGLAGSLGVVLLVFGPPAACVALPDVRCVGFAHSILAMHACFAAVAAALGCGARVGWGMLGGAILLLVAVWRSIVVTLWRRGVTWRGRTYPLVELRTAARRLDREIADRRREWLRSARRSG